MAHIEDEMCLGVDYDEEYGPKATPADAHREWHWNTGVPMGQPGCPQDACDMDYWGDEEDAGQGNRS